MNNIPQKNIIFENSRNNGLPYYNAGSIQYVGNQNINFATLNNTFQQLIDNDLYAENYLRNYADRAVGPKSSAPSAVYNGVEGYKAFSDDGVQMHIYRKHENPLSSSVSCVLPDVHANFVAQIGQYVVAGCDDGMYFEQNGFHRLVDSLPAYGKYFSDQANLIASNDGVYSLIMKPGYDISQYHLLVKLNSNDIGVCRSVHYIDQTHTIVVGTDSGIYEGGCYAYQLAREDVSCTVNFVKMKMVNDLQTVSPTVNGLTTDGAVPLAATSEGLFKPDQINDFSGQSYLLSGHDVRYQFDSGSAWIVGADDGVYSVPYGYDRNPSKIIDLPGSVAAVSARTGTYFATSDGVFRYDGNQLVTLASGIGGIKQLQVYAPIVGDFPVFATSSTVYYLGNDSDYAELMTFDGVEVNDIFINNHDLIAATADGIYKYKLHAGSMLYDSDKIVSSDQVYQSIIDGDFGPSGLITVDGGFYTYSGKGIKGIDRPADFVSISIDNCYAFQREQGGTAIIATSGKMAYTFDSKLFRQTTISARDVIEDVKFTDNMALFRLADASLWQIHKNDIFSLSPELTQVFAYPKVDDITTYKGYAAVRQDTALRFLQERVKPECLDALKGQSVNDIWYNDTFNVIFISTRQGLSAVNASVFDYQTSAYAETQVYSGETYGCWTSRDKVYCFLSSGVDVYDIIRTSVLKDDSESGGDPEYETRVSCVFRYSVMKDKNRTVNGMCEFGSRQLYATSDGLYASVQAENYEQLVSSSADILFCRKVSVPATDPDQPSKDAFICYDKNGQLFKYADGGSYPIITYGNASNLSIVGCTESTVSSDYLYIATSISGLYVYDIKNNEISSCENEFLSGSGIIGMQNINYNNAGGRRVFAECVLNAGSTNRVLNKIFIETDLGVFQEMAVDSNIIDVNAYNELIKVEGLPANGINSAQLFMYMKAGEIEPTRYEVKVVPVLGHGGLGSECDVYMSADMSDDTVKYDKIYASSDRMVYMTARDADDEAQVSTYIYTADAAGKFDDRVSVVTDISDILQDSRGGVYARKGDEYYQAFSGRLEKLLISDSEYKDRIRWLEYYSQQNGYILVKPMSDSDTATGGVYRASPNYTEVTLIRNSFNNNKLYSIQNAFGLIITSYNNQIYWSDIEQVEDLASPANYHRLLGQTAEFNGFCVSEKSGMAYAYGAKFIYEWPATSKNALTANAGNYVIESFNDFEEFRLKKVIPHTSYVVDMHLNNDADYVKPYLLPGDGIYIYNKNKMSMMVKRSNLVAATKLFQIPDGIAYMAKAGVMYTTNCDSAQRMSVNGALLTDKVQDIKHDGKSYYVDVGGRWYYVYHGAFAAMPSAGKIIDIRRIGDRTIYVQDGKFFRLAYAKMRRATADLVERVADKYDVYRIFPCENALYYAVRIAHDSIRLLDQNYATVKIYFDDRPGLQEFEDVCIAQNGQLAVVQVDGEIYFCAGIGNIAHKYDQPGIAFPINAYVKNGYTGFDSSSGIMKFSKYGIVNVYKPVDDIPINFLKIVRIGEGDYLICSNEGLYRYIQEFIYKMSSENTPAAVAYLDNFEGVPAHTVSNGSDVYRSLDLVDWQFLFDIGQISEIRDIYAKSLKDYYVATSSGIVKTIYSYELINDIEQRNEYELQAVVDSLADDLDAVFENQLDQHLTGWHSQSSQMNFINSQLLSVDMSGIADDWQNIDTGDELVIDNDLIDTMDSGALSSIGCEVSTENVIFSQQYAQADYVLKRYMSGVSELLVHVQTTKTYYLNGVKGSPAPYAESEVISRKNLESILELEAAKKRQNSSVPGHATRITLKIPKSVIDIQEVHDVQICPCSLPLKIYSDNTDVNDLEKNGIFNSKVIPSIAMPYSISSDAAIFNFRCFGTDEQSIRIQFTEIKSQSSGFVTVEFRPNGGEGTMPIQRVPIGIQTRLNKAMFVNSGKFFAGWSFASSSESGAGTAYIDQQQIVLSPNEYSDGDILRLNAVWTTQDIVGDANVFGIASSGDTIYIKDAVELQPGGTIIDYGDDSASYAPSDDAPEIQQNNSEYEPEIEEDGDFIPYDQLSAVEYNDYESILDNIDDSALNDNSIVG